MFSRRKNNVALHARLSNLFIFFENVKYFIGFLLQLSYLSSNINISLMYNLTNHLFNKMVHQVKISKKSKVVFVTQVPPKRFAYFLFSSFLRSSPKTCNLYNKTKISIFLCNFVL